MSVLGMGRRKRLRKRPRIILTHPDMENRAPGDPPTPMLDWTGRFGRRSPLSRKIITFNLVALCVLLTGVLYLNQFQAGMLEFRARTLVTEATLIGQVLADDIASDDDFLAEVRLEALAQTVSGRIALFDGGAELIGAVNAAGRIPDATVEPERPRQSAFVEIMGEAWARLSRIFAIRRGLQEPVQTLEEILPLVEEVLDSGSVRRFFTSTPVGENIIFAAVPVKQTGSERVVGALVMVTPPGEVDAFISNERDRILQVFALAIIISIVLSLVLASTIVRPLRALSEAAHEGGTRNARSVNPERIHLPDLSGRPDEIGYLSSTMQLMTTALFDRIESNEAFAADVAHEIKNPLTSLRSAVDTLPYAKTEEANEKLLSIIRQDVTRLDRLVTDISNASRLDSELVRDKMETFDLHVMLAGLVSMNEMQAEKAGAELVQAFCEDEFELEGLENRLGQVFMNLITNALSFASTGDRITVRTELINSSLVRIYVEDQGPGIPDENLADVFERFYSERPQKEEFGNHSGLGLAISKQIVQAHGGQIWAENIRPEGAGLETAPFGARFVVELPV